MFPHAFAQEIAEDFISQISASCERIQIVGSLRRLKLGVNDIDILVIPRLLQLDDDSLFGEPVRENQLDKQLSHLCLSQDLELESNGSKIKRFVKTVDGDTVPIDLYIATEQTWWTLLLIRTGSRGHNIKLARRALELQMHLKADGSGLLTSSGSIVPIASEEDIFRLLNLEYRSPEDREY
jgi:DNA polymerase/3'-5' exonuclease PolX